MSEAGVPEQARRLEAAGVHVPGRAKAAALRRAASEDIDVSAGAVSHLRSYLLPNADNHASAGA